MQPPKWISPLFVLAALYDGILGLLFLLAAGHVFRIVEVTPPNHLGYVQFPAALLLIFALMFVAVARDPVKKRHLISYGILLKIAYCGVTGYHWMGAGVPWIWKPFVVIDLVMGVLFVWAYIAVRPPPQEEASH